MGNKLSSHEKLFSILELFLLDKEKLSLTEISTSLGINKSTANRIASYLVKKDYLYQEEKRGKYSLGMKFLQFNYILKNRLKIWTFATPYLENLSQLAQESCVLILWDGHHAFVADSVDQMSVLRTSPKGSSPLSLRRTAAGKVILANLGDERIQQYLHPEVQGTSNEGDFNKSEALKEQLDLIKKQGFALEMDEYVTGVSGVAVCIKNSREDVLGALTIIGPTVRLPYSKLVSLVPPIRSGVMEIQRWLS